jgi:hypothetical protein
MDVAGVAIAAMSAAVALVSVFVAARARGDSNRAANAAAAAEHRASRPRLLVEAEGDVQRDATDVLYRVHNLDGPDLASVVVHRPTVGPIDGGGIIYPVAATGRTDFADSAEIGPIPLAQYARFTLKLGSAETLPDFRVKITCAAQDSEPWNIGQTLMTPRGPAQLQAEREQAQLLARERQEADQRALEVAQRVSYVLRGGGGISSNSPQWQMTTLRVTVRNDSDLTVSELRLVVGDDAFVWSPQEPIPPGGEIDVQAELNGSLPEAPQTEAGGKPFRSYLSRLQYTVGGRRYSRSGDAPPEPTRTSA